ncbi:hypothetical protein [Arthrobacter sp. MP_M7]|uniref:hypothetical protein n=1 Tax=Arthrobacter sp. MP_M7 TaxID=3071716 RepID=UPI002DF75182|nr:hypothetical protein [Arthrobacter sp. MP_M7]
MTNPQKDWSLRGIGGANANGFVSGVVGSQSGHLAGTGYFSKAIQYTVGAGGSVAGGSGDNLISGEEYGVPEMIFDGAGGAALTRFSGKTAVKSIRALCAVGFVVCVGIAIFVFMNVPWGTRMPYDGKYNRSGNRIPMQIAMLSCLVVLFGFWRGGKKSDAHQMRKGSRVGLYILGTGIVLAAVVGQWIMGQSILVSGGYPAG